MNNKHFSNSFSFIHCNHCHSKYQSYIFGGVSYNSDKKKWKKLSKHAINFIKNKKEFKFVLNNFSQRLINGQFDIIKKKQVIYLCPYHCVIKDPSNPQKYFRVVNNATNAWKMFLALNKIISDKFGSMQVPGLSAYAKLIKAKGGKRPSANLTDLSDAFHQLSVQLCEQGLICFNVCGIYLRARRLEWGTKPASALCQKFAEFLIWVFENCVDKQNVRYCKDIWKGITDVHIDDFLQIWSDSAETTLIAERFLQCLTDHGVKFSIKKTHVNVQDFVHHGAHWQIALGIDSVGITDKMYKWLKNAITLLLTHHFATVRFWYCLVGRLMYVSQFYPPTKALVSNFVWYIIDAIKHGNLNKYDLIESLLVLDIDLNYWYKFIDHIRKVPIDHLLKIYKFSFTFSSDSSSDNIGVFYEGKLISCAIPECYKHYHINTKEIYALLVGMQQFKYDMAEKQGIVYIDNTCAVDSFKRKWNRNPRIMNCIYLICLIMIEVKCYIKLEYINTKFNALPDALSRFDYNKFKFVANLLDVKYDENLIQPQLLFDFTNAEKLFNRKFIRSFN